MKVWNAGRRAGEWQPLFGKGGVGRVDNKGRQYIELQLQAETERAVSSLTSDHHYERCTLRRLGKVITYSGQFTAQLSCLLSFAQK